MLKIRDVPFWALLILPLFSFMVSCNRKSNAPAKTETVTQDRMKNDLTTKTEGNFGELFKIDFPPPFVITALKNANIPDDKVEKINNMLQAKHEYIHQRAIEIGAKHKVRNPFDYPPMEDKIADIFKDVMSDVYEDVLKSNGITNEKTIQDSFEYIQQQKLKSYADYLRQVNKSEK